MATSLTRVFSKNLNSHKFSSFSRRAIAVLKTSACEQYQAAVLESFTPNDLHLGQEGSQSKIIDFDNPATVFAAKSTGSLLQSYAILKACRLTPLVHNAKAVLKLSRSILGDKWTDKAVEHTFFKQFCAGTNAETIKPTLAYLEQNGMLPILNYAAEDDVSAGAPHNHDATAAFSSAGAATLDAQARVFMRSIADCENSRAARGFVGVKLTGLCQPELLERLTKVLAQVGSGRDRGHSSAALREILSAFLLPAELKAFDSFMARITWLASEVHARGNMRMLIDAEQSYMQPAIDAVTIALQQIYNREEAVIMNTYQCYLKDSADRVERDIKRAADEGWVWGAKTVRGAYMHLERARAAERGYESPVHDTLVKTHSNYNSIVDFVMEHVACKDAELMVASHNQASVEAALAKMHRLGIASHSPSSGMYFGQLLGMADNLSFPLGANGYNIYKICAYGSVKETVAFLLRRALENSDVLGGCSKEIEMIRSELMRRINPMCYQGRPLQPLLQSV